MSIVNSYPLLPSVNVEMATPGFSRWRKGFGMYLYWLIIKDANIPFISLIKILINF